ncbi:DUF397 domain-containing protein [Actinomadura sp. 21ATH]|uniref:DUF397 domain-containing protein n=1 Tax=Actinomadura sp. 21ATH TaxID=1735444 RepID=UPI0035BEE148
MSPPAPSVVRWRKSTYSGNGGNCVEAAALVGAVGIRDSKNPTDPFLTLGRDEWAALLGELKRLSAHSDTGSSGFGDRDGGT